MEEIVPSQQSQAKVKVKKIFLDKRIRRLIIILIVLILAVLPSYYFYNKYQKAQALLQNPNQASIAEAQVLVNNVGKLIELPTNESPTVATVSDKTKLKDQPFFIKAENGDKVLVYSQSKMLILYRPSLNKIISVGTVNAISTTTASPSPVLNPSPYVGSTASPQPTSAVTPVLTPTSTAVPAR